ncbi:YhcN/YlaJ family sporulation lipoprotein [Paenibacillus sp. CMAA1364]
MRLWRLCLCLLLVLTLLSSCSHQSRNASPSSQNQKMNKLSLTTKSMESTEKTKDLSDKNHLEALAERVSGVKKAHCVIMGNTAIVGIDVDGDLTRSRVGTIKYSVAEALRKDPRGMQSLVTADMDISHRIAEIGKHIREGRPVSGFTSELADIIGRIIPQLPKDIQPTQNIAPAGTPDKKTSP